MTYAEFENILNDLNLEKQQFAAIIGARKNVISYWGTKGYVANNAAAMLLKAWVKYPDLLKAELDKMRSCADFRV